MNNNGLLKPCDNSCPFICRFLADRFVEGTCPFCNYEVIGYIYFVQRLFDHLSREVISSTSTSVSADFEITGGWFEKTRFCLIFVALFFNVFTEILGSSSNGDGNESDKKAIGL